MNTLQNNLMTNYFVIFTEKMHYLAQKIRSERNNLLSIITTTLLSIGASFLLMLAFANLLEPKQLGVYQYIISVASIIASFSLTGINNGIVRALGKKDFDFLNRVLRLSFYGFIPAIFLTVAVSSYYWWHGNFYLSAGIFLSSILALFIQLQSRYNYIYIAIEEFKTSNYLFKASALGPIIILIPSLFFTQNPAILAILYFGSSVIFSALVIWYFKMPRKIGQLLAGTKTTKRSGESYTEFSIHQSVITLLNSASVHADKIIIFQMLGAPATAAYFIAVSISDRIRGIFKQFEPYLFSKFSKYSKSTTQQTLSFKFLIMLIGFFPIYIGYLLLTPYFFAFFLPKYTEITSLALLYGLTIFTGANMIHQSFLKAHGSTKILYLLSLLNIIIRVSCITIGAALYGLQGAVSGVIVSSFIVMFINYFFSARSDKEGSDAVSK